MQCLIRVLNIQPKVAQSIQAKVAARLSIGTVPCKKQGTVSFVKPNNGTVVGRTNHKERRRGIGVDVQQSQSSIGTNGYFAIFGVEVIVLNYPDRIGGRVKLLSVGSVEIIEAFILCIKHQ